MEYSHKRKQINTAESISRENDAVISGARDPAYQAYLQAVLAGRAKADAETMGHRQDLAPSLAAKMSKAFGMDLSQMKLYRTGAMEGTETKGMASGNKIVLSKDIDLNTMAGQAVLGHEISHVRAQSQGIGMGHSGLYQNAGLEHQADVEGMMAARGQSILGESTGMDTGLGMGGIGGLAPLGTGMTASAGVPMQAKDKKKPASTYADEDYFKPDPMDDWENEHPGEEFPKQDSEKIQKENVKPAKVPKPKKKPKLNNRIIDEPKTETVLNLPVNKEINQPLKNGNNADIISDPVDDQLDEVIKEIHERKQKKKRFAVPEDIMRERDSEPDKVDLNTDLFGNKIDAPKEPEKFKLPEGLYDQIKEKDAPVSNKKKADTKVTKKSAAKSKSKPQPKPKPKPEMGYMKFLEQNIGFGDNTFEKYNLRTEENPGQNNNIIDEPGDEEIKRNLKSYYEDISGKIEKDTVSKYGDKYSFTKNKNGFGRMNVDVNVLMKDSPEEDIVKMAQNFAVDTTQLKRQIKRKRQKGENLKEDKTFKSIRESGLILKEKLFDYLKESYEKYGKISGQMDFEDLLRNAGKDFHAINEVGLQTMDYLTGTTAEGDKDLMELYKFDDDTKENQFKLLKDWQYKLSVASMWKAALLSDKGNYKNKKDKEKAKRDNDIADKEIKKYYDSVNAVEKAGLRGKGMSPKQFDDYKADLKRRKKKFKKLK